jgi:RNA polymerase sporulation-specific sigma factor
VAQVSRQSYAQPQVEDGFLIALAKSGDPTAYTRLLSRYRGFVRLKASSYFLAGGDSEDLIQEGLIGLYKAIRDYRTDRESSFRNFAELCITRQIITAGAGADDDAPVLEDLIAGPSAHDPAKQAISAEELRSLVGCLSTSLSQLESSVLALYLDGRSYEEIGGRLDCDTKTVDNALQRVKRKVGAHLGERAVLD